MNSPKFSGVNLIVKDIEKQKTFYRDILGLSIETDYGDAVFFNMGDIKLSLFSHEHHVEGDASLEGASKDISHLEFSVGSNDLQELSEKLADQGFHAYRDNYQDADGNLFHFNPDGNITY